VDVHARAPRARARAKLLAADDIILNKNGKNNQFSMSLFKQAQGSKLNALEAYENKYLDIGR
jgi:hypothetical protein